MHILSVLSVGTTLHTTLHYCFCYGSIGNMRMTHPCAALPTPLPCRSAASAEPQLYKLPRYIPGASELYDFLQASAARLVDCYSTVRKAAHLVLVVYFALQQSYVLPVCVCTCIPAGRNCMRWQLPDCRNTNLMLPHASPQQKKSTLCCVLCSLHIWQHCSVCYGSWSLQENSMPRNLSDRRSKSPALPQHRKFNVQSISCMFLCLVPAGELHA
jgi:hypothetical protein